MNHASKHYFGFIGEDVFIEVQGRLKAFKNSWPLPSHPAPKMKLPKFICWYVLNSWLSWPQCEEGRIALRSNEKGHGSTMWMGRNDTENAYCTYVRPLSWNNPKSLQGYGWGGIHLEKSLCRHKKKNCLPNPPPSPKKGKIKKEFDPKLLWWVFHVRVRSMSHEVSHVYPFKSTHIHVTKHFHMIIKASIRRKEGRKAPSLLASIACWHLPPLLPYSTISLKIGLWGYLVQIQCLNESTETLKTVQTLKPPLKPISKF